MISLDENTRKHSIRVSQLTEAFVNDHIGEIICPDKLIIASKLHDLGKAIIPIDILNSPNKLTPKERKIIDWHSHYGYMFAKIMGYDEDICQIVLFHHGFDKPNPLNIQPSDKIVELSSLLRVLDVYDALVSKRSYKSNLTDKEAIKIMLASNKLDMKYVQMLKEWDRRLEFI